MDLKLKTCSRSRKKLKSNLKSCNHHADRLSSLPDELLGRILCILPTKDAAATQILSKRMRNALSWISSLDLDDSPISHCTNRPHLIERFHIFESFVDNLLIKLSPPNPNTITRFKLRFGGNIDTQCRHHGDDDCRTCENDCFPDVLPTRLNAWISYPLAQFHGGGLRELNLAFRVRRPHECMLPPLLFACQSLQVMRLDSNLALDDSKFSVICLPNLKLLHLKSLVFNDDDFVTRLVSSCPVLKDLSIDGCLWMIGKFPSISSSSVRRLFFNMWKVDHAQKSEILLLHTPNLQYFDYYDGAFAHGHSIAHMNALVKASINVLDYESFFKAELSLLTALSHVSELTLLASFAENLYFAEELKDQLPVLHNLRTLEIDGFYAKGRWDIVLLLILHHSPSLESLVFPRGLFMTIDITIAGGAVHEDELVLEAEGWRTVHSIPSCCTTHLKRIVLTFCFGSDRELNTIKFFLASCLVLEEFVICLSTPHPFDECDRPNLDQFANTVKKLPRSSNSCLVTLH